MTFYANIYTNVLLELPIFELVSNAEMIRILNKIKPKYLKKHSFLFLICYVIAYVVRNSHRFTLVTVSIV